ncbi:MAG: heme biosynthesis HemY N-terminal domain-containing protein [Rickettsiales bacterium]
MEQKIETTVTVFCITVFLAFVAFQLLLWMLYKLFTLPAKIRNYFKEKNYKDSIKNLSELVIAINDKDYRLVTSLKNKLDKKLLNKDTYSYIKSLPEKYDADTTEGQKARLMAMLTSPKNKISALKQLIGLAEHEGQFEEMHKFSEQLWSAEKSVSTAKHLLNALMLTERYLAIEEALDRLPLAGFFSKNIASYLPKTLKNEALAFTKFKLAEKAKQHGDDANALKFLYKVLKLNNQLTPALVMAANLLTKTKDYNKIVALIKDLWQIKPNCALTTELLKLSEFYRPEKFLAIARKIHAIMPSNYESHILLAKAALEVEQFDEASHQISEALAQDKNQRACILMAEFCERTHGNKAETLSWLKSAIVARKDNSGTVKWDAINSKISYGNA